MKFLVRILVGVACAVALVSLSTSTVWYAAPLGQKVTICHSTGSASNPFTAITVDLSAGDLWPHLDADGNPNGGQHANDFVIPEEATKEDCAKRQPQ